MDTDIDAFPGIYPAGSRMDELLKNKRNNPSHDSTIQLSGDLPELGILSKEWDDSDKASIHPSNQKMKLSPHFTICHR